MINEADFSALGLSEEMLAAVQAKGFETPTSIQRLTIPRLLSGENDIIAQSQTGTGKTAAFGLPILQQIEPSKEGVQSIILVPTRELAVQAAEELLSYNRERRLSITAIYGGAAMSEQLRRLSRGVDIVVGTPGRVLDHIRRGTLKLDKVRFLVLDEADEMLNMGFVEDVEEIMGHTGEDRRVLLFSATMPERIIRLSEAYMRNTEVLRVESQHLTADLTNQIYFEVREADKFDAMTRIIDIEPDFYGIVFCRTKIGVDEVATRLVAQGYSAEGLHGDVSQAQREKILRKFRDKAVNILVATDVAARGIDVSNLSHVINYSLVSVPFSDAEAVVGQLNASGGRRRIAKIDGSDAENGGGKRRRPATEGRNGGEGASGSESAGEPRSETRGRRKAGQPEGAEEFRSERRPRRETAETADDAGERRSVTRSRKKAENDWNASPAGGNDGFDWEAFQRYDDAAAWEKPKRGGGTRSVRRSGRPVTTGRQAAPKRIAAKGRKR